MNSPSHKTFLIFLAIVFAAVFFFTKNDHFETTAPVVVSSEVISAPVQPAVEVVKLTLEPFADNSQSNLINSSIMVNAQLPYIEEPSEEIVEPVVYYVSSTGNDENDGTTIETAWQTIARVNQGAYNPGDQILFEGSQIFKGGLQFYETNLQGTSEDPVVINSFGNGRAVIESATEMGLYGFNAGAIKILNLNFIGSGGVVGKDSEYNGISLYYDAKAPVRYVDISQLDVSGYNIGIFISQSSDSDDMKVMVKNSSSHDNRYSGIEVYGAGGSNNENRGEFYIGFNHVFNNRGEFSEIFGAGIYAYGIKDGIIENNTVHDNGGYASGEGNNFGIYVHGKRCVIQNNEVYNQRVDYVPGGGFGITGADNIIQYNYSHNNDGSAFYVDGRDENFVNDHLTMRYNISENDGQKSPEGVLIFQGQVNNCQIYNNTFYSALSQSQDRPLIIFSNPDQQAAFNNVYLRNNIFISNGTPIIKTEDPHIGVRFENNNYYDLGNKYNILWGEKNYNDVQSWSVETSQEMSIGQQVWKTEDPGLCNPGHGATRFPNSLKTLTAYRLKDGSAMIDKGWNLADSFGVDMGEQDFFGNPSLARSGHDLGANEYIEGQSCYY